MEHFFFAAGVDMSSFLRVESLDPGTEKDFKPWLKVWESAALMIKAFELLVLPHDISVIELGCGTGIAGLHFIQKFHPREFIFTDLKEALHVIEKNLGMTEIPVETTVLVQEYSWGISKSQKTFDFIICSDLVYFPELFQPLIDSLLDLSDEKTIIYLSYKKRSISKESLFFQMFGQYFDYEIEEIRGFDAQMYYFFIAHRKSVASIGLCPKFELFCMAQQLE